MYGIGGQAYGEGCGFGEVRIKIKAMVEFMVRD